MTSSLRHVHTVHLTAPNEALVRRGAILLEDALHTASIPGEVGGRVLMVRSLQIGTIHSHQSSASLALMIEQRLQHLSSTAVHASDPTAPYQPAVYFRDGIEPYLYLIVRLIQNQRTTEWFWRSLVPEWQPSQSNDVALKHLLQCILKTPNGVSTTVVLLRELHSQYSLKPLLSVLCEQDGSTLLSLCGWTSSTYSTALNLSSWTTTDRSAAQPITIPEIQSRWKATLNHWITQWGTTDARSIWFTAMVLIEQKPARLLDAQLTQRVHSVLREIQSQTLERSVGQSVQAGLEGAIVPLIQSDYLPAQRHKSSSNQSSNRSSNQSSNQFSRWDQDTSAQLSENSIPLNSDVSLQHKNIDQEPTSLSTNSTIHSPELESLDHELFASGIPQLTAYGGLFFLLPLMTRLGIADLFTTHPDLIELDLPVRLLQHIADRLSIPACDPSMLALPTIAPPYPHHTPFIAPCSWWNLANSTTWIIRHSADTQTLWDGSGRFPLALWRDELPESLRGCLGDAPIRREPWLTPTSDWPVLCQSWLIAMRRWCRRYANVGLHSLVCRPGHIVATRTHIDVLFDYNQADIRLRKAGLDIDPGWLAWLGRVVSFHYLNGE